MARPRALLTLGLLVAGGFTAGAQQHVKVHIGQRKLMARVRMTSESISDSLKNEGAFVSTKNCSTPSSSAATAFSGARVFCRTRRPKRPSEIDWDRYIENHAMQAPMTGGIYRGSGDEQRRRHRDQPRGMPQCGAKLAQ